jgi:hypothetical protein
LEIGLLYVSVMMQWVFRMSAALERIDMDSKDQVEYTGNGTAGREADVQPTGFFFQMPQREWQGLTDEEKEHYRRLGFVGVEIIETILKEKNYDKR